MKKLTALLLAGVLSLSMMTGCGSKKDDSASQNPDVATEDTSLSYVQDKGTFVLGLDDAFPPMGFVNDDQEIVGFDIDVAKEVTKRMGVELVLQPISWDAKEQELATKNIDCIWNGLTITEDRKANMTMSNAYMKNTQVVVVPVDSEIQTLADMVGKIVVIQNGSTASDAIDANTEFKDSIGELISVEDNVKAMMDLEIGGSDAVVMDEIVARYYLAQNDNADKFRILDESLQDEEYGIAFRKGDLALCDEVNKYLAEMAEDGTLAKISETWFGKDITTVK